MGARSQRKGTPVGIIAERGSVSCGYRSAGEVKYGSERPPWKHPCIPAVPVSTTVWVEQLAIVRVTVKSQHHGVIAERGSVSCGYRSAGEVRYGSHREGGTGYSGSLTAPAPWSRTGRGWWGPPRTTSRWPRRESWERSTSWKAWLGRCQSGCRWWTTGYWGFQKSGKRAFYLIFEASLV